MSPFSLEEITGAAFESGKSMSLDLGGFFVAFSKTIDRVQIRFLHMASFPTVASYGNYSNETSSYFFYTITSQRFWKEIFSSFGLSTTHPKDIVSALTFTPTGHSFSKQKDIIWMHLIRAFLWITLKERNKHLFIDKGSSFDCFFNSLHFVVSVGAKHLSLTHISSHLFCPTGDLYCNFFGLGSGPFL